MIFTKKVVRNKERGIVIEMLYATIFLGIVTFISTNVDDMFILIALYSSKAFKIREIVIGQYIGILTLTVIASLSYFLNFFVSVKIIGLLGVIPIIIAIVKMLKGFYDKAEKEELELLEKYDKRFLTLKFFLVAIITIANGGDNISIYMPLFVTISFIQLFIITIIFIVMTALWLIIAYSLINNKIIGERIVSMEKYLFPITFIIIGLYIIINSKSYELVLDLMKFIKT